MNPRRILYTDYYAFIGGGQQNLLNVFGRLDRRRWTPLLVVPEEGPFAEAARRLGVAVFLSPMRKARWRLPWQAWPAMLRLRSLMRTQGVDLVHANDFPSLKLAAPAARGLGLPVLYHHQIAVTQQPGSSTGFLMRYHAGKADRILVVSRNGLEALAALGLERSKLHLLYNNADPTALEKAKPLGTAALRRAGIPAGRPLLLAAGMRRPHKGFDVLLKALALFYGRSRRPASALPYAVLLGDAAAAEADHEQRLRRLEAAEPLRGNFRALPAQRPLAPWLKRATLFISSSRWEGSPLVVLEAMAAGCAVLATRQASGEVVEHGRSGWLVESEDPAALAEALERLVDDEALRRRLGRAAAAVVVRRFDLTAYLRALEGHYRELLAGA